MQHTLKQKQILAFLFAVYVFYCLYFIANTSEIVCNKRHFVLFDDAMISMRYARNLAEGNGLVWNAGGDKVEGYTNFLWTLYMAIPHYLKIDISKTSLFIQLSALVLIILTLAVVYKTALVLSNNNFILSTAAALLAGSFFPFVYWSLTGMEVGILSFLTALLAYLGVIQKRDGIFNKRIYIIACLLILIRIDEAFFVFFIILFFSIWDSKNVKKHLTAGLICLLGALGIMTLFRLVYYHEFLPNTYYLKMTGYPVILRISRGFWMFMKMILQEKLIPFLVPFAALFFIKDGNILFLLYIFLIQSLYSIYIGGDAWDNAIGANRFITQTMPVFCMSIVIGAQVVISNIFKNCKESFKPAILVVTTILISLSFNTYNGFNTLKEILLPQNAPEIKKDKSLVMMGYLLNDITETGAKIAVSRAGIVPYFANRYFIDILGKNDSHISRVHMQMPPSGMTLTDKIKFFYPGHLKVDHKYAIIGQKPDVVWDMRWTDDETTKYLDDKYNYYFDFFGIFIRKDSSKIKTDILNKLLSEQISGFIPGKYPETKYSKYATSLYTNYGQPDKDILKQKQYSENDLKKINAENARVYNNSGVSKDKSNDYVNSIADFNEAIKLDPEYSKAYYNRGVVKGKLGDNSGALDDLNKAIELDPKFSDAYTNRGITLAKIRKYSGAIDDFNKAIELDQKCAEAYYNRGLTKGLLGDYAGALDDFNQAIGINKDYAIAYYYRGFTKRKLEDNRGALEDFKTSYKLGFKPALEQINR